jgi:tetratricopeptide (TPR) repeat protein
VSDSSSHESNVVSGTVAGQLVQAGAIHGGVHFHRRSATPVVPRQLPPLPSNFITRSSEVEALDSIVSDNSRRTPGLVVLTGAGGTGKTAIALGWLHNNTSRFPDGTLYTDLGAFGPQGPIAPSDVLNHFLRALGVLPEDIPFDLAEKSSLYRTVSAGKSIAIFADNADSAAQVRPLLPASPGSVLIVTSRWRLGGLALHGARFVEIGALDEESAVELLVAVLGKDKVDLEPAPVRQLVELCGGLPIALRVAAARLSIRPRWSISRLVSTLADQQSRLSALTVPGEVSVQTNLDLTYRELSPKAGRLYRLLGLHPGADFDAGLAAAAGELPVDDADDLVGELLDVNLVNEIADDRFRFHDLLRLHAQQLAIHQDGDEERSSAVRRMVRHYLDRAIAADLVVMPLRSRVNPRYEERRQCPPAFPNAGEALDALERDLANTLAAQQSAADRGWWDEVWQLCEALWGLFLYRKHFESWIQAHELGISAARRSGNAVAETRLTVQLGMADLNLRRFDEAHVLFATALDLSHAAGDLGVEATAHEYLGLAARGKGNHEAATAHFTHALDITERLGHRRGSALHLRRLGETLCETGQHGEAVDYLRRAVDVATEIGDRVLRARALTRLGGALVELGQTADAAGLLSEADDILAEAGSNHYRAENIEALAGLDLRVGDMAAARQHLQHALELYRDAHLPQEQHVRARLEALNAGDT